MTKLAKHQQLATLAPELRTMLEQVEHLQPPRMDPRQAEAGFTKRIVALDGAVFLPVDPPQTLSQALVPGVIGGVGVVAVIAAGLLYDLDETMFMVGLLGAGLLGMGAQALMNKRAKQRIASTGILCLPNQLLLRTGAHVLELPRGSVAKIEERMEVMEVPKRGPFTTYRAVIVTTAGEQLVLAEFANEGEPELTLRASHPEGRFIGALVRYLIHEWRDGHARDQSA